MKDSGRAVKLYQAENTGRSSLLIGTNKVLTRDAALGQHRAQCGTLDCPVSRQCHRRQRAIRFSAGERNVIATADDLKSECLERTQHLVTGSIYGKLDHGRMGRQEASGRDSGLGHKRLQHGIVLG